MNHQRDAKKEQTRIFFSGAVPGGVVLQAQALLCGHARTLGRLLGLFSLLARPEKKETPVWN